MKRTLAALVMGIVLGALVMAIVPASADHGADFRRLKERVTKLENKTRLMTTKGRYNGYVNTVQVVAGIGQCPHGSDAIWAAHPTDANFSTLWCTPSGAVQGTTRYVSKVARLR